MVNAGAGPNDAEVLVSVKLAFRAATLAMTLNEPAVAFAVNAGAVATPDALLVACATAPEPLNVPEAPVAGAVKMIDTPASGLLPASRSRQPRFVDCQIECQASPGPRRRSAAAPKCCC